MLPKFFNRQSGTGSRADTAHRSPSDMLFSVLTGRVTKNARASASAPPADLKKEDSPVPAKFSYMVDPPTPIEAQPESKPESPEGPLLQLDESDGTDSEADEADYGEADEADDEETQGLSDESSGEEEDLSDSDEDELVLPEEDEDEDEDSEWECVDPQEYEAYEEHKESVAGNRRWLRDEARLHRNLALRGMFPLMPGSWATDFLGLAVYPILFAPAASTKPVVIHNKSSQFRGKPNP